MFYETFVAQQVQLVPWIAVTALFAAVTPVLLALLGFALSAAWNYVDDGDHKSTNVVLDYVHKKFCAYTVHEKEYSKGDPDGWYLFSSLSKHYVLRIGGRDCGRTHTDKASDRQEFEPSPLVKMHACFAGLFFAMHALDHAPVMVLSALLVYGVLRCTRLAFRCTKKLNAHIADTSAHK